MLSRRRFLDTVAGALAGGGLARAGATPPQIAAILTEYRPASHADVWVTALLEGYDNGQPHAPALKIGSIYTDQVPANDLSRAMAAKHGVPIVPTVRDALTLGGKRLRVDGVLLMAEHGNYPVNEKGQILYPRFEFFQQIVGVFRESHRTVPVFCDKHLSYDWEKAKQMYEEARAMKFPMEAGSSIPFTWRQPPLELDLGTPLETAVVTAYGPKESYGFHALEALQCMVERRAGEESGIAAVQCLEGRAVWEWTALHEWAERLMNDTLERVEKRAPGPPQQNARQPIVFLLDYVDGLKAAIYLLDGHISDWAFGARIRGRSDSATTKFWSSMTRPWSHATGLTYQIEQLFLTRRAAYPLERTLLTTGALAALMDSSYQSSRRLETPHLHIAYRAPRASLFNTGRIPPPSNSVKS